ncbi:MAG: hypothetical protein FJ161_02215, partial [Gammaproteobacteria bacterium]|nr:hypothetical protein [Gammaproteobacteria bacterium]
MITYSETVHYIYNLLKKPIELQKFDWSEFQQFHAQIRRDPLFFKLIETYPPFGGKFEEICHRTVSHRRHMLARQGKNIEQMMNVHNITFNTYRKKTKQWLKQAYAVQMESPISLDVLENFFLEMIQSEDAKTLLISRYKETSIQKVIQNLKEYIDFIFASFRKSATFGYYELHCIHHWCYESENTEILQDRVRITLSALDDSLRAYEGEKDKFVKEKDYSCLEGLELRLLDVFTPFRVECELKNNGIETEPPSIGDRMLNELTESFLIKDDHRIMPSIKVYSAYCQAAGLRIENTSSQSWKLKYPIESEEIRAFFKKYCTTLHEHITEYCLTHQHRRHPSNGLERILVQYCHQTHDNSLPPPSLDELMQAIEKNFYTLLVQIEQLSDDSDTLNYPFDSSVHVFLESTNINSLFELIQSSQTKIIQPEHSVERSILIHKMSQLLRISHEHLKLLCCLIGQSPSLSWEDEFSFGLSVLKAMSLEHILFDDQSISPCDPNEYCELVVHALDQDLENTFITDVSDYPIIKNWVIRNVRKIRNAPEHYSLLCSDAVLAELVDGMPIEYCILQSIGAAAAQYGYALTLKKIIYISYANRYAFEIDLNYFLKQGIIAGQAAIVQLLLDELPGQLQPSELDALTLAAEAGHCAVLNVLLNHKNMHTARVANMESARPAAAIAVNLHNLDMLSLLMSHAKMQLYINDINAAGFGLANVIIYYNNIPAMEIFVKNKYVRPNLLNIYGDTTYMAAAEANRLEILALLMKHTWPCPTVLDQVCDQLVEHGLTSNNKANYNRRLCNLIQALPINPQLNILKNLQKSCRSFYKSSGFSLRWLFNIFGRV